MNMKNAALSILLGILAIPALSFANVTQQEARDLKAQLSPITLSMQGVNMIGVTGCDPATGKLSLDQGFVHCVRIGAETKKAEKALLALWPVGTQIDGIYIAVEYTGPLTIHPRASAGSRGGRSQE